MKKNLFLAFFTFFTITLTFPFIGQGQTRFNLIKDPKILDIEIGVAKDTKILAENEIGGQHNVYSMYGLQMTDKNNQTTEIRFSIFKDFNPLKKNTKEEVLSNIKSSTMMWFLNAFGDLPDWSKLKEYKDENVKNDFNATYGWYMNIKANQKQEFGKDYDKCFVQIFFRERQGLVIRTTLYPAKMKFEKNGENLFHNYKNFRFVEQFDAKPTSADKQKIKKM